MSQDSVAAAASARRGSGTATLEVERSETAPAAKKPHNDQEQNGPDGRIDDFRNKPATEVDTELGKQEAGDQGAGDANENISDDAKTGAAHDLAREPARNQADEQNDQDAFIGYAHRIAPFSPRLQRRAAKLSIICARCDSNLARPARSALRKNLEPFRENTSCGSVRSNPDVRRDLLEAARF